MCSNFVIQVENLSKCYRIYDRPFDRLKQSIYSKLCRFIGNNPKPLFREFWALYNVSFKIAKGESIAIIGNNGSGKSTLLQLICGTLNPTSGFVKTHGRIAALLELGSGFNSEFSGRENIYMNGAILGLTKTEINQHLDEIIEFADIGEFINYPTKTYSSGMLIRLAFAVQACVEPDILIIDEALAVGDALFQKKCFEYINRLRAGGTTLLFVSHDQESVRAMTDKAIFLEHGSIKYSGTSANALFEYRKYVHKIKSQNFNSKAFFPKETIHQITIAKEKGKQEKVSLRNAINYCSSKDSMSSINLSDKKKSFSFGDLDVEVVDVCILNRMGEYCSNFEPRDIITIIVQCKSYVDITHLNVGLRIRNKEGIKIYSWGTLNQDIAILSGASIPGNVFWKYNFSKNELFTIKFQFVCGVGPNLYEIQVSITEESRPYYFEQRMLHWIDEAAFFTVNTEPQSYHFGGIADLRMVSNLL